MQGADFVRDTTVEPDPQIPGRYIGELSGDWVVAAVPQGGILVAVAVQAMAAELAVDHHQLRSVNAVFAAQIAPGPIEIDVTVLRRGRSMSQASVSLRNVGRDAGLAALAVFGASRPGFEFTDLVFPEVDPPNECPSFRDPWPEDQQVEEWDPMPFWERVEGRPATGHAPWDEWIPTTSERVYWYRFDDPPLDDDGSLDPLALVVLGDTMPGAVSERMGGGTVEWFGPSADLTVHLFGKPATSEWVLARNLARQAGDGYASIEMELWDPTDRRLLAYATQQMFFAFSGPVPEGDDRLPRDQRTKSVP